MTDETTTFMKEQKQIKNEKALEKKTQKINKLSYTEMKSIVKLLQKEVNFDKAHHTSNFEDFDFSNFNDPNIDGQSIARLIDDNDFIIPATHLNIVYNDDDTVIYYQDQDPYCDNSLVVSTVLDIIKHLVALGRHGIYMRAQQNKKLQDKVNQLEDKMDL